MVREVCVHLSRRRGAWGGVVLLLGAVLAVVLGAAGSATGQHSGNAAARRRHRPAFICKPGRPVAKGRRDLRHFPRHSEGRKREKLSCVPGAPGVPGGPGTTATGTPGGAGPPGPRGPTAKLSSEVIISRATIPFTSGFQSDGGNVQNLAKVGPFHVDGLCRHTFPGSNGQPGPGGGERNAQSSGTTVHYPAPFFNSIGGEDEAQVIIWSETGSLSFSGKHGKRTNIPPGPPDYTTEITAASPNPSKGLVPTGRNQPAIPTNTDRAHQPEPNGAPVPTPDPVAGEGDHLFLAASNETVDEVRATDPQADNYNDPSVRRLNRYPAFMYSSGWAGTSDGHLAQLDMVGGFDVLGVYDACVFSGVVRLIS